jgi:hypothetical protein
MDKTSIMHGIGVFAYLVILAVLLFVILIRQGIPRRAALEVVEISAGIFVFALVITYEVAERLVRDGGDSVLIYIPPVIPAAAFALWLLRRRKKKRNEAA